MRRQADSTRRHPSNPQSPDSAGGPPAHPVPSPRPSSPTPHPRSANAELAEFYQACPMAAVVDLDTVAHSPEKVDSILPPYRETAAHAPNPPLEPAVPRIRYPVHLSHSPRIATNTPPAGKSDWLIDPKEWLGTEPAPAADALPTPDSPAPLRTPHSALRTPHSSLHPRRPRPPRTHHRFSHHRRPPANPPRPTPRHPRREPRLPMHRSRRPPPRATPPRRWSFQPPAPSPRPLGATRRRQEAARRRSAPRALHQERVPLGPRVRRLP